MTLFRSHDPFPVFEQTADQRRATQLLNASMSYARLILRRYGQLAPFAFSMDREGQIARETLSIPRLPRDPELLWKLLTGHISGRVAQGAIQAVVLAANVALTQPSQENYTDAIILDIEQETGHGLEITVPYKIYGGQMRNLLPRRIALGQHVVNETGPRFFTAKQA